MNDNIVKISNVDSVDDTKMFDKLVDEIIEVEPTKRQLNVLKTKYAKEFKTGYIIKNTQIIAHVSNEKREKIIKILNIKPIREMSGVSVVALFAKPHACPHGKCIYCPGGIGSEFGDTPQSYTGAEPAALRAIRNDYDAYFQVFNRLEHYVVNGHIPDKIELIFMGGTFPSMDKGYRDEFVYLTYKAVNDFAKEFLLIDVKTGMKKVDYSKFNEFFMTKEDLASVSRDVGIRSKVIGLRNKDYNVEFSSEILLNQKSSLRCIGLTVETKPDWAQKEHLDELLKYGCTRLEIGVQSLDDDVLRKVNRGHGIAETIKCFQVAKDMCFKINAHMMLGLPSSTIEGDKESLIGLFEDSRFRPDMLKIYPCLVVRGTPLFRLFEKGEFIPIETTRAAEVIGDAFGHFPRYVRVMRVQRDIPTPNISGGVVHSNLRQFVDKYMEKNKIKSCDIRAREIGFRESSAVKSLGKFKIKVEEYLASSGKEFFIDVVDDNDSMIGFVRLRFPSRVGLRPEISVGTALIRELHVYGSMTSVGSSGSAHQHRGWGKRLLARAEDIARKEGFDKMLIISGVGVREYYEKFGYSLEGVYMVKNLLI